MISGYPNFKKPAYWFQLSGTGWESEDGQLPPLLSLYNRTYRSSRLSGGVAREFTTLAFIGDLLLQGRIAEGMDALTQRLKSLELTANGTSWATSQKLELVPPAEPSMGTRQEYQVAQRESKLDASIKGSATTDKGKGKSQQIRGNLLCLFIEKY